MHYRGYETGWMYRFLQTVRGYRKIRVFKKGGWDTCRCECVQCRCMRVGLFAFFFFSPFLLTVARRTNIVTCEIVQFARFVRISTVRSLISVRVSRCLFARVSINSRMQNFARVLTREGKILRVYLSIRELKISQVYLST